MKKTAYLLLALSALLFPTCKKAPELKVYEISLDSKNVAYSQTSAEIKVEYTYPTPLQNVNVTISESSLFGDYRGTYAKIYDTAFIANFVKLETGKTYYYKFEYSNGINNMTSQVFRFDLDAAQVTLPTVETLEPYDITTESAVCGGKITDDGGYQVIARGVCWATHKDPTIFDSYINDGNMGIGEYSTVVTGLQPNTLYYVRAYAINEKGTSYDDERSFMTKGGGGDAYPPYVETFEVTDITATSAVCGGEVIDDGGMAVTAQGICWARTQNPTINNSHTSEELGSGYFYSQINDLEANTTYFVRAYATNAVGTGYGEVMVFETTDTGDKGLLSKGNSVRLIHR